MTADPRRLDLNGIALTLLASLIWGGNTIAVKASLQDLPPFRLAWLRFIVAGLTILVWAWLTKASLRVRREEQGILFVIGVIFVVQIGLFHIGINLTTAGHTGVLLNVYPMHLILLSHFFVPGDRLTGRKLLAVLSAYAGVVLVFIPQFRGGAGSLRGDLIVSGSAILLGIRTILLTRAVQRVSQIKVLLDQVVMGIPVFFLLDLMLEQHIPTGYTPRMALAVLYQGVLVSGFNFMINLWLLKHYRPSTLAPFFLTTPLFSVLLSWWILDEPLTAYLLAGAFLVAVGIGLATLRVQRVRPFILTRGAPPR